MSSYLRVLRFPNFRYLFLGQSASNVGDQVVIVALALYVTERTGSATDLGFVLAAQALPMIALILFGGVWADRFGGRRRRIMIGADSVRAGLHLHAGRADLRRAARASSQMIVIEALFGAARAFFNPAYTGLIPQTVPDDHIQEAQALSGRDREPRDHGRPGDRHRAGADRRCGRGVRARRGDVRDLGGAADARPSPRARDRAQPRDRPASRCAPASARSRSRPWVWATISAFCVAVLFSYAQWYSLAPSIAHEFYGGADRFGVLESVAGVGAVLGALIGMHWRPKRPLMLGLVLILIWPVQNLAFATLQPFVMVDLAGVQRRADVLAVRDLVGDRARAPHPGRRAVTRQLV